MVAIFASNMHYLCHFIYLDILHINYALELSFLGKEIKWVIEDVFPLYDASPGVKLNIQMYFYFIGSRITNAILAYLLLSAIGALSTLMRITVKGMDIYRRVHFFTKVYLFVQLYNLLAYLLFGGQLFHGLPLVVYIIFISTIFFIRKTDNKWEFKGQL